MGHDDPVLAPGLPLVADIQDWRAWLREPFEEEEACSASIRRHTHTAPPCGANGFVDGLDGLTGKTLRPKPRGPKPGTKYRKRKAK